MKNALESPVILSLPKKRVKKPSVPEKKSAGALAIVEKPHGNTWQTDESHTIRLKIQSELTGAKALRPEPVTPRVATIDRPAILSFPSKTGLPSTSEATERSANKPNHGVASCERAVSAALDRGIVDKKTASAALSAIHADPSSLASTSSYAQAELPFLLALWNAIHADRNHLLERAAQSKMHTDAPEVVVLRSDGYFERTPEERRHMIDAAYAAMAARESGRSILFDRAVLLLEDAVRKDILAPEKVGTWLRRIFESDADPELIRKFLSGEGNHPLSALMESWNAAAEKFELVERKRLNGKKAPGFHFVTKTTFLKWHYAARLAYVQEAEDRLENDALEGHDILWDIRRELDMHDWDQAQWLIEQANRLTLTADEHRQLQSMKRYLTTQKTEDTTYPQRVKEAATEPKVLLLEAMQELYRISPAACHIYEKAIRRGFKAVNGLNAIMYNRCWMKANHIGVEERKTEVKEEAVEETKQELVYGDDGGHKKTSIPVGGESGIRKYEDGEWASQVMFVNNDPGRQEDVLDACETSNKTFRYWSSLFIDGVDYDQQRHVVFSVSWKIKKAMRSGAVGGLNELRNEAEAARKAS